MFLLNRIFSKTSPLERKIAGILFCIAFLVFVLVPLFKQNKTLNKEILQKRDQLLRYKQILIRETMIKSEYQKSFFDSSSQVVDKTLIFALKALEAVASKYAIKIIDIKQTTQGERESLVPIELLLEGKKEDYMKFIYDLANGRLLFKVKKCDFKAKENSYLLEARFLISYIPTP
jgi:hypothetical protein